MKYRKLPVIIEAVQITDATFDAPRPNPEHVPGVEYDPILRAAFIPTLEGPMRGNLGDWIITGVKGEHYPCKPDVFAATYEPAIEPATAPATLPCGTVDRPGWVCSVTPLCEIPSCPRKG